MAKPKSTPAPEVSDILEVTTSTLVNHVLGTSPLILNRMSEKAKHELLMPKGRKNAVEKATTLKHQPIDEYRASAYVIKDDTQPTYLALMSTAFKGSLRSAALDMPGAKKAQIGRLTFIEGDYVGVYGIPKLFMAIVRSADMNKTPDVRTRAILPRWAARVEITFVHPLIRPQAVANLLSAAGLTIGVGDGRPEKGAMSYGQFRIVAPNDPEYLAVIESGGRQAQQEAIEHPVAYDDETQELLSWFDHEKANRSLRGVA
jgi:hypothetical protein